MKKQTSKGFTLIELLIVIGIISVLLGMGTSYYSQAQKKARDTKKRSDLKQIQNALELYRQNTEGSPPIAYPTRSINGETGKLGTTCAPDAAPTGILPFIKEIPCDDNTLTPTPYYYGVDNTNLTFTLCACLEAGTAGDKDCSTCGAYTCTANKCAVVNEP